MKEPVYLQDWKLFYFVKCWLTGFTGQKVIPQIASFFESSPSEHFLDDQTLNNFVR